MATWSWNRILTAVAGVLIVGGMGPLAYFMWWQFGRTPAPVSMPISLSPGEYVSPLFRIGLAGTYYLTLLTDQIPDGPDTSCVQGKDEPRKGDCPETGQALNLDWQIIDERGVTLRQGTYGGIITRKTQSTTFAEYQSKKESRVKILVKVLQKVEGYEAAHPTLELQENPEYSLELPYIYISCLLYIVLFSGSGVILLWIMLSRRR